MIDKISGNDVYGYTEQDQKKRKSPAVRAYENTPGQKKAAEQNAGSKRRTDASRQGSQGVILDLSNNAKKEKKAAENAGSFSVSSALRKLFSPIIQWLKEFWESDGAPKSSAGKSTAGLAGMASLAEPTSSAEEALSENKGHKASAEAQRSAGQLAETGGQPAEESMSAVQMRSGSGTDNEGRTGEAGIDNEGRTGEAGNALSGSASVNEERAGEAAAAEQMLSGSISDWPFESGSAHAADDLAAETDRAYEILKNGFYGAADGHVQTETDRAYEILKNRPAAHELDELPPLEDIGDLPSYGAISEEALKSGSLQQIEQLLTRNGARQPARNSDLLTYYDRFGKLIELDETERHRVLFGDKNVMKL